MFSRKLNFILAVILSFSWHTMVMANEAPDQVFKLGEIVVSDTTGVKDIAINNTLTEADIKKLGAVNVGEALKFVPGLNVLTTTKGETNISLQGFQQQDILILLDGVPYYETKYGKLDLQQIPASIISRIDVSKGASSVLYGPNGMGGVVNIVTKKGGQGFAGNVRGEIGPDGYHHETLTVSAGQNGLSVLAAVDNRSRDSIRMSNDYTADISSFKPKSQSSRVVESGGDRINSDLDALNLWSRIGYAPTDAFEVYASVYRFEMERGRAFNTKENKVFTSPYEDAFTTFARIDPFLDTGVDLSSRIKATDWLAVRAMFFYHDHEDDYVSYEDETMSSEIARSRYKDNSTGGALFTDLDFGPLSQLSLSAHYKEDEHKDRSQPDLEYERSRSATLSLAAENTAKFGPFTMVAGLAFHNHAVDELKNNTIATPEDESTVDPMAGLTWTSEEGVRVYGSIAKKTRFATFGEVFSKSGDYNPLKPQKNINYTLGVEKQLFDRLHLNLSGFYNDVSDMIVEETIDGDDVNVNVGTVDIHGIEISSKIDLTKDLSFGLDYTWVHARNESENRESDYVEDMPEHTVGASVDYRIPYVDVDAALRGLWRMDTCIQAQDDNIFEDSFTVDLTLSRRFGSRTTVYVNAYNLLDEFHYDGYGMPNEGRFVKAGVEVSF